MNITFLFLDCKYNIFLLQRKIKQFFFVLNIFFILSLFPNNDQIMVLYERKKLRNMLNISKKESFF